MSEEVNKSAAVCETEEESKNVTSDAILQFSQEQ